MPKSKDILSRSLLRSLQARGESEMVIVSQQCRQMQGRLVKKGYDIEHFPIIDAVSLHANHKEIARLSSRNDVRFIEKNANVHIMMDVARGTIGDIPPAQNATGKGVTIAIADTGISDHPDFEGRILAFCDLIGDQTKPYDDHGHGTMCAGCAAGSGKESGGRYKGVAPDAQLVIIKSMDDQGGGSLLDVIRAMQWVSDHRVEYNISVLSLSLGIEVEDEQDSLMRGVEALWTQGIVVVAAAGNSGPLPGTINSPGRARSILTIGAVDDRSEKLSIAKFSSRGPVDGATKPELCAPGVRLMTTKREGYGLFTGTSAATPIVAGCAALLLEEHPTWSPDLVKRELMRFAHPIAGDKDAEGNGCVYV